MLEYNKEVCYNISNNNLLEDNMNIMEVSRYVIYLHTKSTQSYLDTKTLKSIVFYCKGISWPWNNKGLFDETYRVVEGRVVNDQMRYYDQFGRVVFLKIESDEEFKNFPQTDLDLIKDVYNHFICWSGESLVNDISNLSIVQKYNKLNLESDWGIVDIPNEELKNYFKKIYS